jgi:hyperosmotically inducible protein
LAYKVDGSNVTLYGAVVRPTLKDDAERVVKKVEGVENVTNNIEVLPVSPNDDRIRRDVYRAIYSQPGLDLYSLRAVPTIHIIVKNGNVTLTGAVGNQADKDRAGIAANGVSGVFSVKNELAVNP